MTLKFSSNNNKNSVNQLITIFVSVVLSVMISYIINNNLANPVEVESDNDEILTYIENNADKVIEALNKHYQEKVANNLKNRDKVLATKKKELESDNFPVIGDSNAKVTLIEFFDYNCGYCKKAFPPINKVINEGLDLKVVFIDFPILGPSSELKAKASIAAHLVDSSKYLKMHMKLMSAGGAATYDSLAALAESIGYKKSVFLNKMKSEEVSKIIKENRNLARDLSINGTPAFIINDKFFQGMLSYEVLKDKVLNSK